MSVFFLSQLYSLLRHVLSYKALDLNNSQNEVRSGISNSSNNGLFISSLNISNIRRK